MSDMRKCMQLFENAKVFWNTMSGYFYVRRMRNAFETACGQCRRDFWHIYHEWHLECLCDGITKTFQNKYIAFGK